jgi:serine protease
MKLFSRMLPLVLSAAMVSTPGLALAEDERFIVTFTDEAQGRAALVANGARTLKELGPQRAAAARIPAARLEALRRHPAIEFIEEDARRYPLAQRMPYGISLVQADQVWSLATGANRTVCVIDSGLSLAHEDIQGSDVTGHPSGWNEDVCGHGTHVAGTIAALNNTTGVVGVLPNGVKLHIIKVFDGANCGWSYASDLVDALNRCVAAGAHVVNMSLGGSFSSRAEESAFSNAYANGVLSIAAAGNDGTTRMSYPASYDAVVSVAALDASKVVAGFSQKNDAVELAAPGVQVLSTVPWKDENLVTVGGTRYTGGRMEGGGRSSGVSGSLVGGGLCDGVGSWSGRVVLCERGAISFAEKVRNVRSGGGVAAVIYNNVPGLFLGTLGNDVSPIPVISLSQEDGQHLMATSLGATGTVVSWREQPGSGYEAWDGTSMASPHVAGVAALVWSYNPSWTNVQIRDALQKSAEDLGVAGRDNVYGFGLVRARAALDYLNGGGGREDISLRATGSSKGNRRWVNLTWSGAQGRRVDVFRNGSKLTSTSNTGAYTDDLPRGATGTFTHKVCETGSSNCSNETSVSF